MIEPALIIDAVRIPRAKAHDGAYSALRSVDLLTPLFDAVCERNEISSDAVDQIILGCSTQVDDQGANIAKIASLYAGWSDRIPAATLNSFCCSGLDAINLSAAKIMSGADKLTVAGGVEKLSNVPVFADKGAWFSDPDVAKATGFIPMGVAADLCATHQGHKRSQLDDLALESHRRASSATEAGHFARSMISIPDDDGQPLLETDQAIRGELTQQQLTSLPPYFENELPNWQSTIQKVYGDISINASHTVATSPGLVDGASLVLLGNEQICREKDLTPRAKIVSFANASDEPVRMLTGHIRATEKLLAQTGIQVDEIDLWEVNESFATTVLHYCEHFAIPGERMNVHGGALAMGHPLGATGGNLMGTLLDELDRRKKRLGVVSICGGAGIGVATLIERVS